MQRYREYAPTGFDVRGLNLPDRQDWYVHPCGTNRDANALTRSNFEVSRRDLSKLDPSGDSWEVHRFGHWACGWFEIILVAPDSAAFRDAEKTEAALENYPVLCDEHFSETEQEEADETWRNCYNDRERAEYIREHRSQFEFRDMRDLVACVRGRYFAGYASDLIAG